MEQIEFNNILQFYRARNEHLIGDLSKGRKALSDKWRNSFMLCTAVNMIATHMFALQERMKGPHYDVYGPWPCGPGLPRQI